jgi:hypothetical protein
MKSSASLSQRLNAIADDSSSSSDPQLPQVEIHVAVSARERLEAARLVARAYIQEGYLAHRDGDPVRPFFSPHHLLKETTVFVAKREGRIIGTLAVILDSRAGLPMEELYGDEIKALRLQGRRLCEICSLAVDLESTKHNSSLVMEMFSTANTYARCMAQADDVCLTIKPSHARFYSRIAFESFGGLKLDERFAFAETLAMRMRRETVEALANSTYEPSRTCRLAARVFALRTDEEQAVLRAELEAGSSSSRALLNCISWLPEILANATPEQIEYLWQTQSRRSRDRALAAPVNPFNSEPVLVPC